MTDDFIFVLIDICKYLSQWNPSSYNDNFVIIGGTVGCRYKVAPSLIGRGQTHNQPWILWSDWGRETEV